MGGEASIDFSDFLINSHQQ